MATVANPTQPRNRITHYAYLGDTYGTAELLNGSGWLFRKDGERQAILVSYKDPDLMLLGLVDLSEMQEDLDTLLGGAAGVCTSRQMQVA